MLAGKTYCPVLHTRVAEIKGLEMLPEAAKALLFPLFVARPWPNAKHLQTTWDRIERAFGQRRFAVDLDPFMEGVSSDRPANAEFNQLFERARGYRDYYEQIEALEFAVPVLQLSNGGIPDLEVQVREIHRLNRGAILRLQHGVVQNPSGLVAEVLQELPETVVFIDLGWYRDLLSREVWASDIIRAATDLRPEIELVVAGSSFPDSFRPVPRDEVVANERFVFDALSRRHNAADLRYGDWGSTRAPREPSPMRLVRRIDVPQLREWVCFRDDGYEDYSEIARRALNDPLWPDNLNIWGTYLIEGTADSIPGSIRGQAAAAAARINIHLYRQANFNNLAAVGDGDEPFVDIV